MFGMAFEKLINLSNEMYQREGVALINKRPTLETAEKMGAICFFLIGFSKDQSVFAVPLSVIQSYVRMSQQPKVKKSIPRADFDIYGYLVDQTERAPVDYLQYIDEAVTPVMLDGMIQFDQEHKKTVNNIEAAKEKMANKKRKLLNA
ncbi:hypothetical protein FT639_22715 [Bacillus mycoides]|nr:hypothetical protein [Bacillus mycoides]